MKSLTQVVLPIGILVALIAGVTFVSQYSGFRAPPPRPRTALAAGASADELLHFPISTVQWDDDDSEYMAEFELRTRYRHDFRFVNRTSSAVALGLKLKSCQCAQVSVALATAPDRQAMAAAAAGIAPAAALGQPLPLAGAAATADFALTLPGAKDRWQSLDGGAAVTVPPGDAGLVRVSWEGKKVGPERLAIDLWTEQAPHGRVPLRLQVPLAFVPAIRVDPATVKVRDIAGKDQQETAELTCWSSTRTHFPLTVREENGSDCFVAGIRPLTADERQTLATQQKCRVLSGYRVTVTVHERRPNGDPLDLGPLERKLRLNGPADCDAATVTLTGMVRGEVKVLSVADADRIELGSFSVARGTSKTVPLAGSMEVTDLVLESCQPDHLQARLERRPDADGRKRWDLHVTAPPQRVVGRLPADSVIVLQTRGDVPRRMRIPVAGQGTQ